jgi:hypothetical protein
MKYIITDESGVNKAFYEFSTREQAEKHLEKLLIFAGGKVSAGQQGYQKALDEIKEFKVLELK